MHLPRLLAVTVLALCLTACGFQLRGSRQVDVDLGRVHVSDTSAPQLAAQLRRLLQMMGQRSTLSVTDADVLVAVSGERTERRVLSVDPRTGKVREFEMSYEVSVSVRKSDGTPLIDSERILFQRDFVFDETAALGKFEEERILVNELREDAAETILHRLESLSVE